MPKKKVTKTAPKILKNIKNAPTKKAVAPKNNKKVKNTPIFKPDVKLVATKQGLVEVKVKQQKEEKKDTRKYVKVYENDPPEKRKEIGERVYRKEIKFAYYASEGSQGVWYYVIL